MPSTVLFKFRHSKTFEPLTFPGSFTKLFQIKKTISEKLKLGFSAKRKPIDFELAVQDAVSGIEYTDEEMVIIDGARLIVYRIPAEEERGKGLLARIQRHQPTKNKSYMHRINGNKPIVIESCNEEEDFDNEHVTIIRTGTDESSEAEEQKDSRKRTPSPPLPSLVEESRPTKRIRGIPRHFLARNELFHTSQLHSRKNNFHPFENMTNRSRVVAN